MADFKITLQLVIDIEKEHGSLYKMAENLVGKTMTLSEIVKVLKIFYRHAGSTETEEQLEEFILKLPCDEVLMTVLLDILGGLDRLGAVLPGEALTAHQNGSI